MTRDKFSALAGGIAQSVPDPQPVALAPTVAPVPTKKEDARMLGGRVPDSIFRAFGTAKGEAEVQLGIRKVTTEAGLEAFVRMLRRPEVWTAWTEELEAAQPKS